MTPITQQINNYLPLLTEKQLSLFLEILKNILQVEPKEKRISIQQYNKELEKSIKQAKSGKTISHADLLKEMERW